MLKKVACSGKSYCEKRRQVTDEVGRMFKILADHTRLELLFALQTGDMCVGDLVNLLGFSQSLISHQLKVMRDGQLVLATRRGNKVYYSLADDHVVKLLEIAKVHASEKVKADLSAL